MAEPNVSQIQSDIRAAVAPLMPAHLAALKKQNDFNFQLCTKYHSKAVTKALCESPNNDTIRKSKPGELQTIAFWNDAERKAFRELSQETKKTGDLVQKTAEQVVTTHGLDLKPLPSYEPKAKHEASGHVLVKNTIDNLIKSEISQSAA